MEGSTPRTRSSELTKGGDAMKITKTDFVVPLLQTGKTR
jgi:hypothetical protein